MACILWQLPSGDTYWVAAETPHTPPAGAFNTGRVDWKCGPVTATPQHEVDGMLAREGIQWGSAIKWVTNKIGLKQCSSCKSREVILNHAKELGWREVIRQLKETL